MTWKNILPQKNEIINIIFQEFSLDEIRQYIDVSKINNWIILDVQEKDIYKEYILSDSLEWVILRLCIYFIKKYYPKESFESIGEYFNRSNVSVLYGEAKDWLNGTQKLEVFIDGKIKTFVKKKYKWMCFLGGP